MVDLNNVKYYTVEDVAEMFQVTIRTVRVRWYKKYNLSFKKIGIKNYISEIDLQKMLDGGFNIDDLPSFPSPSSSDFTSSIEKLSKKTGLSISEISKQLKDLKEKKGLSFPDGVKEILKRNIKKGSN